MSKLIDFLENVEDILIFNFVASLFIWHLLDYSVLKLAKVAMVLAGFTTMKRIIQVDFTSNSSVINRL